MIARLTAEHEEIGNGTSDLRSALLAGDQEAAASAAKEVAELMHPHTGLEERGLFAEMRKDELFTEHIDALCGEHATIDRELAAIAAGDLSRVQPLLTLLADHIDREENGLFPSALVYLEDEQWDYLQRPETLDPGTEPEVLPTIGPPSAGAS
ncbi:MAG: hemerythrin domain-containing protein [Nakamurella sp.]